MAHQITGASLEGHISRLNGINNHHPFEGQTFCDWATQAGDTVTVVSDGHEYESPLHSTKLVWRGASTMGIVSGGLKTREAISKISRRKYGRGGTSVRSEEKIYREFTSSDGLLHSAILMTESVLRTEFDNAISDVHSTIEQTAEHIYSEVYASESSLYSYVEQTATYISSHVENALSGIGSEILQTANQIRTEVHAANSLLYSYVDQTATSITSHVESVESSLGSQITQTASAIRADVYANNSQIYSTIEQTADRISSEVVSAESRMGSAIVQTASAIRADVYANNSEIYSTIEQTADRISSEVVSAESRMGSAIVQTASQIRTDVYAANSEIYSTIDQTASGIRQQVRNTASDLQSAIDQQADKINLVVEGTGSNAHIKASSIALAINSQTGQSTVKLSADIIELDGSTIAQRLAGENITIQDLTIYSGADISIGNDSTLYFGSECSIYSGGGYHSVDNCIIDAEVDDQTNTLTLTRLDGSTINFSKAASINSLTGSWSGTAASGMKLTVVTNPSTGKEYTVEFSSQTANQRLSVDIDRTNPPEIITGTTNIRVPIRVYTPGTGQYDPAVDRYTTTAALSLSSLLENKTGTNKVTANGTYTPSTGYIGFSSVEVNVPSQTITPVLTGGWNGTTFNVSSTPASTGDKGTTLSSKHSYDSSIDVHYIDVDATDTGAQAAVTRARYVLGLSTGSVSSGSRTIKVQYKGSDTGLEYVCNDYGNGQNAVTLNDAAWQYDGDNVIAINRNTNTVTVSTAGRSTQLSKSATVYLDTSASWSNNTKSIYVRRNNSSGEYVAVGSVTAPAPTVSGWSLGTYTSPYGYKPSVSVNGTTYTSGTDLNATGAYDAGWTAGQTGSSASSGARIELYRSPTGDIAYGTTYTVKAKGFSSRSATAKSDISGATLSITTPAFPTVNTWSLGSYTSPYTYKASVKVGGTTYTSGNLNAVEAYAKGWTTCYDSVQLDSTTATTLGYGGSVTVYAQAYSTKDATSKTNKQSRKITAPAFPTVNTWSLGSYTSPYTYKASVKVGGTTYTSGNLYAVDAYDKAWTNCYSSVQLDSTTATTLSYGQSITVYAQAYSTKDSTSKTNKQSRTITAPADRYGTGWDAAYGKMSIPVSAAYGSSITIKFPSNTHYNQDSAQYDLSVDNSYAYIKLHSNANTVARVTNTGYTNGYTNGSPNGTGTVAENTSGTTWKIAVKRNDGTEVNTWIDCRSIYNAGYIAGWAGYYNDSHWDSASYNSSTKKYECWIPSKTVTWNGSSWVSGWDYSTGSNGWFQYTNSGGSSASYALNSATTGNDWPASMSMDQFFGSGVIKADKFVTFPASRQGYKRYVKIKVDSKWFVIHD